VRGWEQDFSSLPGLQRKRFGSSFLAALRAVSSNLNPGKGDLEPALFSERPVNRLHGGGIKLEDLPAAQARHMGMGPDLAGLVIMLVPAEMQQVQFMGSGVLMFPSILLAYLKRPWFFETVQRETYTRFANQDVNFVWRLQEEALAKVWVDTTIKVGHIHSFVIDETFQDRFPDWTTGHGDPEIAKYISLK